MKKMKNYKKTGKTLALLTGFSLLAALWGCTARLHTEEETGRGRTENREDITGESREENSGSRLSVVTTIFPYYDFIRQVGGDRIELSMVVPAGMDSHSFEPTPADMKLIQDADLFICNGGEMEHWVSQALEAIDTSGMDIVTMMDYVRVFEEEHVEGMEGGHDHEHEEEDDSSHIDNDDGHNEEIEYDEHIWTSPVNAVVITGKIREALSEKDPENKGFYKENAENYQHSLEKLDREFKEVMKNRKRDMIVLGDKFPFRYLAEEYDLNYRAAFSGCSTDTEPSARTIAYLIEKVKENHIPAVYYLELSSHRVAEIISEETGAEPLLLHSCHNVTRKEFESGITYMELMEGNVESLRKGLDE